MKKFRSIFTVLVSFILVLAMAAAAACAPDEPEASSITLDTGTVQTEFLVNDVFTSEGLAVTAHYDDGTSADVTADSSVSSPNMSTAGTKTVTVTWQSLKATYDITVSEVCTHQCPVCGLCMDMESQLAACAVKCGSTRAESYTFESENSRVITMAGSMGAVSTFENRTDYSTGELVSGRGNFSSNKGASIAFEINSPADTTVSLLARVSRGTGGITTFTAVTLPVITSEADGSMELLSRSTKVQASRNGTWFDFQEVNLGCIQLKQGINTIRFAPTGTAYNFDYIALLSDEVITWSDGTTADIIGEPRHGLTGADANAEEVEFGNVSVSDDGNIVTSSVTCETDITGADITLDGKTLEGVSISYNQDNACYDFSFDVTGLGLADNSSHTVRFVDGEGNVLVIGKLLYVYSVNINVGTDDSAWTRSGEFRAYAAPESETLSEGVRISSKLRVTTGRPNDDNYYPVGNLDMSKGQWVAFYVNASEAATVGLYMELGQLAKGNTFRDWLDLKVNGKVYNSDAAMPTGTNYVPSNTYVCIGFVPLQQGNNEIVFTVNSTTPQSGHNIYGLQFTSETAELSWGVVPEILLESIAVSENSTVRTEYLAGETFDPTGLILDLIMSDGETLTANDGFTVTPDGALTAEDTFVTVSYTDGDITEEVQLPITVTEPTVALESLAVDEQSVYETEFLNGEVFDPSGITLIAYWSDGSTTNLTAGQFTVSPAGALTAEDTVITFSYSYAGVIKTVAIPITVTERNLESVTLNADAQYKTEYTAGEMFDPAGLALDASFSDGTTATVSGEQIFVPQVILSSDDTSVTVSYTYNGVTKSVEVPVTVAANQDGANYFFTATTGPGSTELSEGVTTAAGASGATNIAEKRPNDDGYYPIGNLNSNIGASVTFTVNVSENTTVELYAEFSLRCDGQYTFDQVFRLEINGQAIECSADMPYIAGGTTFAASDMYISLGEIGLQAGENTITFTTVAINSFNIYGIAFDSSVPVGLGAA